MEDALTCPVCNTQHPANRFLIHVYANHPDFFVVWQSFGNHGFSDLLMEGLQMQLTEHIYDEMPELIGYGDGDTEHDPLNEYESLQDLCDRLGNVKVGVPDINQVSVKTTVPSKAERKEDDQMGCPICLSSWKKGCEIRTNLCCKKSFCSSCIETWFAESKRCPLCNVDVVDQIASISTSTPAPSSSEPPSSSSRSIPYLEDVD